MTRSMCARGLAALALLLSAVSVFAATYTSSGSGDWNQASTWGGAGVPGSGDTVTITSNHVVTVTGSEVALSVTLDSTPGNKILVIDPTASLLVELSGGTAIAINAPAPGSSNVVRINGGTLEASNLGTNLSITGGTGASKLEFTSLGGTAKFEGDVLFAGTAANAVIDFGPTGGTLELGGDLDSGGTIVNNSASAVVLDGTGAQTINPYTFNHFTVNKAGGTATLNGPITVNGDLAVTQGVLDDGGYPISLNPGSTSTVTIGSLGVLKLGSAATATSFPSPYASTSLNGGSAVVYQSGQAQSVDSNVSYSRLYLATLGGSVNHAISGASLTVSQELNIADNGVNQTTLVIGTDAVDLNADLTGDGTVSMTSGSLNIGGNASASISLSAGTGTVTYDGGGAQQVLGATYHHLAFNKGGGTASLSGNATVNGTWNGTSSGTFDAGSNTVTLLGNFTNTMTFLASNATFRLNGASSQTWSDSNNTTIGTFEINNTSSVSIGNSLTVTTALNLNGGVVTVSGSLFVDVLATVTRTAGWINGPLTMGLNATPARTFFVGTSNAYLPVTVDAGSAGTLTLVAIEGKHPNRTADNVLERYWRIQAPTTVTPLDTITFNYNQTDVVTGDETKYILASYDSGTFTQYGDVNDAANTATETSLSGFLKDWIIGQPGSLGAPSQLAITAVNGGTDPSPATPFNVVVESQDDDGDPTPVAGSTGVSLGVAVGSGTLGGTTSATINAGTSTTTILGVTYAPAETNVQLSAARTSGDILATGTSAPFDVVAPSTITVSSLADSGPGTLRAAITAANGGGCTTPCTIDFSVAGEISLATALPAITVADLLIDGSSAPGALLNTNAYGLPSNAGLTVAINGGGTVNIGFDVQAANVDIKGFAIRNFTNAGALFSGTNTGSSVTGCYIGTDLAGSSASPNPTGVQLSGSTGATIGGTIPAARNLISGNTTWGILADTASSVTIAGNYVGTNAALSAALPNNTGIRICDGCSATLGTAGVGNVISGNTASGLVLAGDNATVTAHYIGTAGSAATAIPNATGIQIDTTASLNTIGGGTPADMNVIGGNSQNGILLSGSGNVIDNNLIGIAADGVTARPNGGSGIRLENGASSNVIGSSLGNKIAYNTNDGVTLASNAGIGNVVRRGKIAGNGNRGIDLNDDGTTNNDATDGDTGPNNLQNFPTLNEARANGGNIDVKLTLNSSGGVSVNFVRFDVYKADGSPAPQAIEYLGGSGCLAGNVFAGYPFSVPAGSAVVGNNVVATATAYSDAGCTTPSEGTSELSAAVRVGGDIHWITGSGNWETPTNWNPATVPASTDNAYIDNSGTYTVTINSIVNVGSIQVGAAGGTQTLLVPASQSLNLNSGTSNVLASGILTVGGIGLGATGPLNVAGTFNWNAGSITGAGGMTVASGGTLNIDTASAKAVNAGSLTIANGATANWLNGAIGLANAGFIDNFGLFEAKVDSTIQDIGSAGTFDNAGTFRKSTTAGSTTFSNVTFNHTGGTVDIQTGTLNLAGGTASAPIAISSGATLLVDDNTYTFAAGTSASGAGKVHINGGTLAVTGPAVTIDHVQLDSGILGGSGTVSSGANAWQWFGGSMAGGGATVLSSGGSLVIGTAAGKTLNNRTLTTQGSSTTTVTGSGSINLTNGGNVNNAGLFDFATDVTVNDAGSDGGFDNTGTLRKSAGGGSLVFSNVDLVNSGTIEVYTGTFNPGNVTSSGPITLFTISTLLADDATVTLNAGTDVSGTGLLHIANGTVTANTADTIPNLKLALGTLNGTGNVSVTNLLWDGGTMSGAGTTTIPTGATATIDTAGAKSLQRTYAIQNGAVTNVPGSGAINMANGGNFQNDGTFEISTPVTFNDAGTGGDIVNTRTFRVNAAGTVTLSSITLNSSGASALIDVPQGVLDLADGANSSTIAIGSGAALLVNSDTYTFGAGTTVTGAGTVSVSAGTLSVPGNVSVPNFSQTGGTVDGAGVLTLTNVANWSTGTMQGGGTTEVGSTGTLNLITPSAKALNNRTLSAVAGGTINLTGNGTINLSNGANVANAGTLLITADNTFNDAGLGGNVVNTGTMRKQTATGPTTLAGISLTNNGGLIDLQSGTINITGADTFTQNAGSTLKIWLNGTTPGTGFGQVSSAASVNLAGTLEVALVGPYQPVGGDTFRVVAAPAHSGDFTQPYTYPTLANSRTFSDAYDGSGLLLTVSGNADLSISKTAPSNVVVGAPIAYTLTVNNAGPDVANSVSVTDTLQTGHSGISANGTGWTCNVVSLTVTCTAATLASGAAPAITINATAPNTPQTFTNVANVSSSNDATPGNNSGSAIVTVDPNQADVEVTASGPGAPVAPSTGFTLTFNVKNNGPQTATGVTFSAPIPATLTYGSATPSAGTCNYGANTVSCTLGSILASGTANVVLSLSSTTTPGTHSVTGSASAVEGDPTPANNSTTASVAVTGATMTVVNTNDAGPGSLRQALLDTQNGVCTPLPCTIAFSIGSGAVLITPATTFPALGNQIIVDATTQPGYTGTPLVEIDGIVAGTIFTVTGSNSAIRGFSLTNATIAADLQGDNNTVQSCYIGLDPLGGDEPNNDGIAITGNGNTIGGTTGGNIISANMSHGVVLSGTASGNTIAGNRIGTDAAGASARPNVIGIEIVGDADTNVIGGATTAHRNLISGNSTFGIYIEGQSVVVISGITTHAAVTVDNTLIQNNWIGLDALGTSAIGNTTAGITLFDNVSGTTIIGNVISGNADGISLAGANVTGTTMTQNLIGVAANGTSPVGNTQNGILVADGVEAKVDTNTIAYNGVIGVALTGGQKTSLSANSIHSHPGLGIDINGDGATANDPTDADAGPNGTQNKPTITSAVLIGGGNVSISWNLDSSGSPAAVGSVRIEYFKADADEGRTPITSVCLAGNAFAQTSTFNAPLLVAGDAIVATATSFTDASCSAVADGTSEFSNDVLVTNCTPPPVTITGPAQMCAGAGPVVLDAGPGFASYNWSNGATTQTISVSPASTQTYTVTVTNGLGCPNSDSHTVTVNPLPAVTITGPTSTCAGGNVTLDAGPGFAQYAWSTGATTQTITVSPSSTQAYSVTVTDGNGCAATDTHTVTVTANPTVTITGPLDTCTGTPVTLDAGPGYATYSWSTGATTQTITVSPSSTSTYSVTVGNGTCSATDTHTVTVNTTPTATITPSGPTTFCAGGSVTLTASAGTSWLWSNGAATQQITVTSGGTFTVQVFNGSCSATSSPQTVTVNPAPVASITGPTSTCTGTPVTLDAGPGFAQYLWNTGATTQTITVSPSSTQTFTVTVTDASSCTASDTHTVTVSSNPTATIVAPAGLCENTNTTASVAAQSGATYTWSVTNGTLLSGQGTSVIAFAAPAGTVTLSVTVNAGSCTSNGTVSIPVSAQPSTAITAPATAVQNEAGLVASVPLTAGASYTWSVTNGTIDSGQGTNSITFTAGESGTTDLAVTAVNGGCTLIGNHQILIESVGEPQQADLAVTKSAPATVLPGASITYTIGVANRGDTDASGVVITDNFPAGTSFVSMNGGPWNCSRMTIGIRCTGTALANSSSTITLTLTAPQQSATLVNTVDATSATPDAGASNNTASVTTSVVAAPPTCAATPPALLLPVNAATVTSPVTFSWSAVSGATAYELWVNDTLAATTTATTLSLPMISGTSAWFVVARLATGCDPLASATRSFTIAQTTGCGTNVAAQVLSPAPDTVVNAPATITWTAVPGAIGYRVWIERSGALEDAGVTDGETSLTINVPPGAITVTVQTLFSACPPVLSAPVAVTVSRPDACAARSIANPIAPPNAAVLSSSSVTFEWGPAARANGYRVWASIDGGTPAVIGSTTTATTLHAAIPRGDVLWWIEALYEGCASTESQSRRFTIPSRSDCTSVTPQPLSPANGSQTSNASISFAWTSVPGAVSYEVRAAIGNGTPTLLGVTTSTSLTRVLPPGTIDWFVRAIVDRCASRDSQTLRFTVAPPASCAANDRPIVIEPADSAKLAAPVSFAWNAVPGATGYDLYAVRDGVPSLLATTTKTEVNRLNLGGGVLGWFVRANFGAGCSPLDSTIRSIEVVPSVSSCTLLDSPLIAAPGQISSGIPFLIQWTPVNGASSYQLQLSSSATFANAQVFTTSETSHAVVRTNDGSALVALYARVRAIDGNCAQAAVSPYGAATAVFILPSNGSRASVPVGGGNVQLELVLGPELAGRTFVATPKQAWLTVTPASGVVGANGSTLTVTATTSALPIGTSLGGVVVALGSSAGGGVATNDSFSIPSSFSVSMVTPVSPSPKDTPPPDALIIPAIAHAGGINSQFQSDVRVSNTSAQVIEYQLTFTPSGDSGITQGQQTQFSIEPGQTIALDDILESMFGTGNGSAMGTLEIRPLTQTATSTTAAAFAGLANFSTFASSRTFNTTSNGTFGQYIPAIPFANFIGREKLLSLQQIAQSAKYRTNLGIVEGSGNPASVLVRIFGSSGQYLTEFNADLRGGQHLQLNSFLRNQGITELSDGRVEIEVQSGESLVTAYASVLDNDTSDPLLVTPVTLGDAGATTWVVPGVADLVSGFANWQTDMRLFNAGQSDVDVTLTFRSQGGGDPKVQTLTLGRGQVRQFDRALSSLFDTTNDGGAVHIKTADPAKLIATARTYNQTTGGTYGQFISAVTPAEATGLGSRPLQLLQVEESERFRSNVGLVEVTGKPVRIEISAVPPDTKFTAVTELDLQPNEFRQLGSLLKSMGLDGTYNARVTVRVIEGDGKVTAYASVIDMITNDPTYVPAQ